MYKIKSEIFICRQATLKMGWKIPTSVGVITHNKRLKALIYLSVVVAVAYLLFVRILVSCEMPDNFLRCVGMSAASAAKWCMPNGILTQIQYGIDIFYQCRLFTDL